MTTVLGQGPESLFRNILKTALWRRRYSQNGDERTRDNAPGAAVSRVLGATGVGVMEYFRKYSRFHRTANKHLE
jgi:hypothetical protein